MDHISHLFVVDWYLKRPKINEKEAGNGPLFPVKSLSCDACFKVLTGFASKPKYKLLMAPAQNLAVIDSDVTVLIQ